MLLFVAGITIGSMVFSRLHDPNGGAGTESVQGSTIVQQARSMGPSAVVLVKGPPVAAAGTRDPVQALTTRLQRRPQVTGAVNAYTSNDPMLRAPGGHASLIVVRVRKDAPMMAQKMAVNAIRSAAHNAVPGATVQVGGDLGVMRDGMVAVQNDLYREAVALPVLLLALFFIFCGWRAAMLPIAVALTTTADALILLMAMTHVTDIATYAVDVIILFGLALAVDYRLLMVNRFREARYGLSGPRALPRGSEAARSRWPCIRNVFRLPRTGRLRPKVGKVAVVRHRRYVLDVFFLDRPINAQLILVLAHDRGEPGAQHRSTDLAGLTAMGKDDHGG